MWFNHVLMWRGIYIDIIVALLCLLFVGGASRVTPCVIGCISVMYISDGIGIFYIYICPVAGA